MSAQEHLPSNINEQLRAAAQAAEAESPNDVPVELTLGSNLPQLSCSAAGLTESFLHIIQNARRAVRDKGHGAVSIKSEVIDNALVVTIRDSGVGISPEHQPRLFEPFFTTREVGDGIGQGLALAWAAVVKEHHGELTFDSRLGEGTTFVVRLPLQRTDQGP